MSTKLQHLGEETFLSHSVAAGEAARPAAGKQRSVPDPSLVVVFGWMGGADKHLQKYLSSYHLLYPAAAILLVKSSPGYFLRSSASRAKALQPAHSYIQSFLSTSLPGSSAASSIANSTSASASLATKSTAATPRPPVLIHTFSNGGCTQLEQLNRLFLTNPVTTASKDPHQAGVPARAFVFDSCPGDTDLGKTIAAFSAALPKSPFVRWPASFLLGAMYFTLRGWFFLTGGLTPLQAVASYLNTHLPPSPRLYIYSKSDAIIPYHDVVAHATESKEKGVDVTVEEFVGTKHVSHAMGKENAERYWKAVEAVWEKASRNLMGGFRLPIERLER